MFGKDRKPPPPPQRLIKAKLIPKCSFLLLKFDNISCQNNRPGGKGKRGRRGRKKEKSWSGHKPLEVWNRSNKLQREMLDENNHWVELNAYHTIQENTITKIMQSSRRLLICTLKSKGLATPNLDFFVFHHCIICLQNIWNIVSMLPEDKRSVTSGAWGEVGAEVIRNHNYAAFTMTETKQTLNQRFPVRDRFRNLR